MDFLDTPYQGIQIDIRLHIAQHGDDALDGCIVADSQAIGSQKEFQQLAGTRPLDEEGGGGLATRASRFALNFLAGSWNVAIGGQIRTIAVPETVRCCAIHVSTLWCVKKKPRLMPGFFHCIREKWRESL